MKFKEKLQVGWKACATRARDTFAKWKRDREQKKFWNAVRELGWDVPVKIIRVPGFLRQLSDIAQVIGSATGDPWLNRYALEHIETYLKSERETDRFVGAVAVYEAVSQDVDIVQFFPQIIRLLADENELVRWKAKMTVNMISEGLGNPREMDDKCRDHYFLGLEIAKALQSDWARQLAESNSTGFTNLIETCGEAMENIRDCGYFDSYVRTVGYPKNLDRCRNRPRIKPKI